MNIGWKFGPEVAGTFVSTEIVPDEIQLPASSEARENQVLQECEHDLAGLVRTGKADPV